jgi:hypothetical protein
MASFRAPSARGLAQLHSVEPHGCVEVSAKLERHNSRLTAAWPPGPAAWGRTDRVAVKGGIWHFARVL